MKANTSRVWSILMPIYLMHASTSATILLAIQSEEKQYKQQKSPLAPAQWRRLGDDCRLELYKD
jgi:hypothetical protein